MNGPLPTLDARYPHRATSWQLRTQTLSLGRRPLLMGIVNVTPDSFSDGGKYFASGPAIEHALRLAEEGADLLDIGGESTRPYAASIAAGEELDRVLPVVEGVARQTTVPISIDTSKSAVASAALSVGAEIINDISALRSDPAMVALAADSRAGVCAMHMQGTPQTMQNDPQYQDVVEDIHSYLSRRRDELREAGVEGECICLDPGIGFGKTHQHNMTLMARCSRFHALGCPILVGHSRKGFLARILGNSDQDRTAATVGAALALAAQGVQILRVHDIRPLREALLAFEASGGIDGGEHKLAE